MAASKIHAKFEWHVQTVYFIRLAGLGSTEIMNRIAGSLNQFTDLFDPCFTRIFSFRCYSWLEPKSYKAI